MSSPDINKINGYLRQDAILFRRWISQVGLNEAVSCIRRDVYFKKNFGDTSTLFKSMLLTGNTCCQSNCHF